MNSRPFFSNSFHRDVIKSIFFQLVVDSELPDPKNLLTLIRSRSVSKAWKALVDEFTNLFLKDLFLKNPEMAITALSNVPLLLAADFAACFRAKNFYADLQRDRNSLTDIQYLLYALVTDDIYTIDPKKLAVILKASTNIYSLRTTNRVVKVSNIFADTKVKTVIHGLYDTCNTITMNDKDFSIFGGINYDGVADTQRSYFLQQIKPSLGYVPYINGGKANCQNALWSGGNKSGTNYAKANFSSSYDAFETNYISGHNFQQCNFKQANLSFMLFERSNFTSANLSKAEITMLILDKKCILTNTKVTNATWSVDTFKEWLNQLPKEKLGILAEKLNQALTTLVFIYSLEGGKNIVTLDLGVAIAKAIVDKIKSILATDALLAKDILEKVKGNTLFTLFQDKMPSELLEDEFVEISKITNSTAGPK